MIKLLELKFSRRWQANKIESDWSNSPRHSFSRQFRSPRYYTLYSLKETLRDQCTPTQKVMLLLFIISPLILTIY